MGSGASQILSGLPAEIKKDQARKALGEKFNDNRWNEIVNADNNTITFEQLKAEVATHSHNYPCNKLSFEVKLEEEEDERVEQDGEQGRPRINSAGVFSVNYPPNHPKSRTTSFSSETSEKSKGDDN